MPYHELEQFLGRGNEKVFWVLSFKDVAGIGIGLLLGQQLGQFFGDRSLAVIVLSILGGLAGWMLTRQYHGMMMIRRLWYYASFLWRRRLGLTTLNGRDFVTVADPARTRPRVPALARAGRLVFAQEPSGPPPPEVAAESGGTP